MKKLSASDMNLFFKCPFHYKLLKIDQVQGIYVKNDKRDLGSNIHNMIAEYYKIIPEEPSPQQIQNTIKDVLETMLNPELKAYQKEAETMMGNFQKFELNRYSNYIKPMVVEGFLQDENFVGKIDYFDGEKIIDWKTGAMANLGDDERRQGKIYEVLLNHNGFDNEIGDGVNLYKNYKIYFAVLSTGRMLELPITTEAWLMEQAYKMRSMIAKGDFPKIQSPLCNWDEVQLSCEFEEVQFYEHYRTF